MAFSFDKFENIEQLKVKHNLELNPSQSFTFDLANPNPNPNPNPNLCTNYLRIAILDSPIQTNPTAVAAMIVPIFHESDWIFCTDEGHRQLLFENPKFSRIVLIGNVSSSHIPFSFALDQHYFVPDDLKEFWKLFVKNHLCPISSVDPDVSSDDSHIPISSDVKFLTYNKYADMVCRSAEISDGSNVGPMLIEIIGLKLNNNGIEFRKRLTFQRTPNLIQTQVLLSANPIPEIESSVGLKDLLVSLIPKFMINSGILVQPSLNAMVTGLTLMETPNLDKKIQQQQCKPRVLCVGVGGGAMLSFLRARLDFEVVGVEVGRDVLRAARKYFGLTVCPFVRLIIGDGIKLIKDLAKIWYETLNNLVELPKDFQELDQGGENLFCISEFDARFDVIMVDLVSSSVPAIAPPPKFIKWSVLESAKYILDSDHGVLIINVLRSFGDQKSYDKLVRMLRMLFGIVYKIKVEGDEANEVLIAARSSEAVSNQGPANSISTTVRSVITDLYLGSMERI